MPIARLSRTVFHLSGGELHDWIGGLITNKLSDNLTFAALLTPQGKIIADFFVHMSKDKTDELWIETPEKFAAELFKKLRLYKLRAPVTITQTEQRVYALWGDTPKGSPDPRLAALGNRYLSDTDIPTTHKAQDYDAHRLSLGVPDSQYDFETSAVFPSDVNMDLLHGVDYAKGCFIGQEVVSRMKRMTVVKKRFRTVILNADAPEIAIGTPVMAGERVIGEIKHIHPSNIAMALIRLDRWQDATIEPTVKGHPIQIMMAVDGQNH